MRISSLLGYFVMISTSYLRYSVAFLARNSVLKTNSYSTSIAAFGIRQKVSRKTKSPIKEDNIGTKKPVAAPIEFGSLGLSSSIVNALNAQS